MLGFVIITLGFGGCAAAMTGRSLAIAWRSRWFLLIYMALLAMAVRFLHFVMLTEETIFVLAYSGDFAALFCIAWLSFAWTRRAQMRKQYGWLEQD